ncbi:DUF397 domain-containing protein [Kitasatospora sp. NPDC058046]|uniref:DUF397 domain-containing protein n=1 Tax=Kitasatospora sp. NPDC058046 TaxID=3346312 RepID=UPI0036DE6177
MSNCDWQKSSYSGNGSECVEIRTASGSVELRESDEGHLTLHTTPTTFAAFLRATQAGEFDHHA